MRDFQITGGGLYNKTLENHRTNGRKINILKSQFLSIFKVQNK
jgi:hypothetical protein